MTTPEHAKDSVSPSIQDGSTSGSVRPSRFALVFAATFVVVYSQAMLINLLGNGAGMMPSPLVPCLSERAWKAGRLERLARQGRAPGVIVMGSSRFMQVRPDYLRAATGEESFNYGVSLGCPVDFLTQLRHLIAIDARPRLILVGADEFAFGDCSDVDYFDVQLAGRFGLLRCIPLLEHPRVDLAVIKSVSLSTTRKSLANLLSRSRKPTREREAHDILLPDGYRLIPDLSRALRDGSFRLDAGLAVSLAFWGKAIPTPEAVERMRPSGRRFAYFVEFLRLARAHEIKVRVGFNPLQPRFEREFLSTRLREVRAEVKDAIKHACEEQGAVFRDLSDLAVFHGDPDGFSDGTHAVGANITKMTNVLLDLDPDHVAAELPDDLEILENLPAGTTLDAP